ncbi:type IV toxin-antitoxin system AbiEi family antitoxin domain-containing protein [bacterium]|nr:type IV toxin-antitoxin system AbiEi family antitoxin domain-containing protein [bacterium]
MNVQDFFGKHNGYARMNDLKENGFHTRVIAKALNDKIIEKVKPGLYKLIDYEWDENSSFVDITKVNSKAVICLNSALHYYNLSTINPNLVHVAVPNNTARFSLDYPPVKLFYFSDTIYPPEIIEVKGSNGTFKIYSIEKTICDAFRYRKRIGEDLALEALKNYVRRKESDLNRLHNVANECKIDKVIEPYIKAMVIE